MRTQASRLVVALVSLAGLHSGFAHASSSYPPTIRNHLALESIPSQNCTLCHATTVGGSGTVSRAFGETAIDLGLTSSDTTKLTEVLDAMATQMTDSDGDGMGDIDELKAKRNPNAAEMTVDAGTTVDGGTVIVEPPPPPPIEYPDPAYGCSAPSGGVSGAIFLGVAAVLSGALLSRRRRSQDGA